MATIDFEHCDIQGASATIGARFLHAYLECSDKVQAIVREMLDILFDANTDNDDRYMALLTLADALFPKPHNGKLGMDLAEAERDGAGYSEEARQVLEEFDAEEEAFSQRLLGLMKERGMTQEALAKKLGIGQPAIANMLARQCRPQRRTVVRLAEALGVSPEELWPRR